MNQICSFVCTDNKQQLYECICTAQHGSLASSLQKAFLCISHCCTCTGLCNHYDMAGVSLQTSKVPALPLGFPQAVSHMWSVCRHMYRSWRLACWRSKGQSLRRTMCTHGQQKRPAWWGSLGAALPILHCCLSLFLFAKQIGVITAVLQAVRVA